MQHLPKRPDKFTKTTPNKRGGCKHIDTFLTCCSRMKDMEGLQREELPCEDVTFKIYKNIKL